MAEPDGKIGHAELQFGDSVVMLSDEFEQLGVSSPTTVGGTPVTLSVYVPDVDAVVAKAVAAGSTLVRPIEDVSPEEMERRAAEMSS